MIKPLVLLTTAVAVTALTACGSGGNSDKKAADSQLSALESAVAQNPSSFAASASAQLSQLLHPSSAAAIPSGAPSKVDVCSLLSPADANAVATADKLDSAQTASTTYTLKTTKDDDDTGGDGAGCRFDITDGGAEGTVQFMVQQGSRIAFYNAGMPLHGLGDEAYTDTAGGTVVRVGGLLIREGDDSFSDPITIDLLRKMVPNLK